MLETIFLRIDGSDENDGTRARPVASLDRAVALAAALPHDGKRRIFVGGGTYYHAEATLDATHSGLELVAARGAKPAFYGGTPIKGWRLADDASPFWIADVPGVREGTLDFRALIVNGEMAPRARFPETGSIVHASEFPVRWMSSTKGGWERKPTQAELTTLNLVPGSLPHSIRERNAELTIYHAWDESLVGIQDWDRADGKITFLTPAGHPPGAFGGWVDQARTFVVWNTREGMTRQGQWYLDREQGQVVYWPREGEPIDSLHAIAPTRPTVLRLAGTAEAPVRDVSIKGITFGVTTTPLEAGGFGALKFGGAIEGEFAHNLKLDNVTVRWSGGQGVRVLKSDGLRCRGCTVHDTGAGGLILSGNNGSVSQSLIHHNGRIYPSSLAMRVHGETWRVHHNTLHHTPYSAINAGGHALRFEHNRFHHVVEELVDGAAIYIFAAKSCVLRGNFTYDVRDRQVHAYYLDEQSENSLVEKNVAVDVPWPIHNHMARNCIIRGNVCLHTAGMRISFGNCDSFTLSRNVLSCGGPLELAPSFTGIARLDRNVFYSAEGNVHWHFHDRLPSLERNTGAVRALPSAGGSIIADLGCRCEAGKITFADTAGARQLGLSELDVSGAGCGR